MFRYLCPHCVDLHASSFQRPPARWAAEPDETHTDECPRTGLPVVYHLSDAAFGEPRWRERITAEYHPGYTRRLQRT